MHVVCDDTLYAAHTPSSAWTLARLAGNLHAD